MKNWKENLVKSASAIEDQWDVFRFNLRKRLRLNDPIQLVPYRTYGTANRIYIKGRMLENKNIAGPTDKDTILQNLVNMYKRFGSDEVPGAQVQVNLMGDTHEATTDKEGYFVFNLEPVAPIINDSLWHPIPLMVIQAIVF